MAKWAHPKEKVVAGDAESYRDTNNAARTTSLFLETLSDVSRRSGWEPVYTVDRKDNGKYKSMYLLFMEDEDPTGYTTAMRTVGSFKSWQRIWAGKQLAPHMDDWQIELEAKIMSESIVKMRKLDNPTAAKWLADKGWEKKRGRPSAAEITRERRKAAQVKDELLEDAKRIGIV